MDHGIYIHVPFCRRKCDYCSFYSVPLQEQKVPRDELLNAYCARLCSNIREHFAVHGKVSADTVYFGGGTPSIMGAERLSTIIDLLIEQVDLRQDAEITLEVNPEDATHGNLSAFRDSGINRMVLGMQTSQEQLHSRIGRSGPLCTGEFLDRFFGVRGFTKCADLINGIPGQDRDMLITDLETLTSYSPAHISSYLLSIDRGTPLFNREVPDDSLQERQREHLIATRGFLTARGYEHYEISNYALPGYESRHNMKYWTFQPYAGFGPGAHSFYSGERYINSMSVKDYIESGHTQLEHDIRDGNSRITEYLLTGLRLIRGICLEEMEEKLKAPLPGRVYERIMKAAESGHVSVVWKNGKREVSLTREGLFIADRVIYEIVQDILP